MGSQSFIDVRFATGTTAEQSFKGAREEALYLYGHNGYTGSIAEKHNFIMLDPIEGKTTEESAWHYINKDPRVDDKFGPAGCIKGKDAEGREVYCFFGWASA